MAKKKFEHIVEESFNEGYQSEPEIVPAEVSAQPPQTSDAEIRASSLSEKTKDEFFYVLAKKGFDKAIEALTPTEKKTLIRNIEAGDEGILNKILGREDRSTYYLTDLHRACIDVVSHEGGIKKNDVIVTALEQFFTDEVRDTAKELIVSRTLKKLEKEIKR